MGDRYYVVNGVPVGGTSPKDAAERLYPNCRLAGSTVVDGRSISTRWINTDDDTMFVVEEVKEGP